MNDEIVGQTFGILTVVSESEAYVSPSGGTHRRYLCKCECGRSVSVLKEYLTSGRQKSCGCLRHRGHIVHGEIHTRLYRIWANMVNRCTNQNNPAFDRYGGRGITVCDEWRDYATFAKWAKENGYNDSLTIDRADNNKGYFPENCRFVGGKIQANNKRNNQVVTYRGISKTVAEWSDFLGINYSTLHRRLKLWGGDIERAFNQPVRKHH